MELREQSPAPVEPQNELNSAAEAEVQKETEEVVVSPAVEAELPAAEPEAVPAPEAELPAAEPETAPAPEAELPAAEPEAAPAPEAELPAAEPEAAPAPEAELPAAEPEVVPAPEAELPAAEPETAPEAPKAVYTSKDEVLAALKELSEKEANEIPADELSRLKHVFYNFRNAEVKAEKDAFVEAGNAEEAFVAAVDPAEESFKELLNVVKEKKAAAREALEAVREENLAKKKAIIDAINEMSADTDNVNRHFQRVKELQAEFKAIGEVSPVVAADIWKNYQDAVERYYDQLKINKELRDYDFRKNLSDKQLLLEEAEKLSDEPDVVVAFRRLQALHDKWREIGPVAKEIREELWAKFKDASAVVNKRYQAHFEERKSRERENEEAKTALCERVEALDFSGLKTYAAWDEMTQQIIAAQEEWKKLGFASKKMNNALFARFRETCDRFFTAKADFFKSMKDELAQNLEKKTALCERAEALKESTDWKKTTDELVALQKEWKTIGAVAKKHSDAIWHRFLAACDHFFDQKKKATSGARKTEQANLKLKQAIIDELRAIEEGTPREEILQKIRDARTRWQEVGHVPFREKDKIYEVFRAAINELYDKHDIRETRARFNKFEADVNELAGDDAKLNRERERLARALEQRRQELVTYQNNLGFLSSRSKSGESMLREMERRADRIKEDIAELEKKIAVIDEKM